MRKLFAFTLAEVLITLAIIGVVAALTIPTLVVQNQQRGWNTAATVFTRKLDEAVKVMNTQGILAGYENTEAFVAELSRHLKITKICKNDNLLACFEDTVWWGGGDAEPEEIDMSKIKTAKNFGLNDWDSEVIGMQLANGTSALIAYNPECKENPYSNQVTAESCVAVLYDTSGFTKPNTSGKDLRGINIAKLGNSCAVELNGTCFGTAFFPEPLTITECTARQHELGLAACHPYTNTDYFAGAAAACGSVNNLPTREQLKDIAKYIYNTDTLGPGLTRDESRVAALGINVTPDSTFKVYNSRNNDLIVFWQEYGPNSTSEFDAGSRGSEGVYAICVIN